MSASETNQEKGERVILDADFTQSDSDTEQEGGWHMMGARFLGLSNRGTSKGKEKSNENEPTIHNLTTIAIDAQANANETDTATPSQLNAPNNDVASGEVHLLARDSVHRECIMNVYDVCRLQFPGATPATMWALVGTFSGQLNLETVSHKLAIALDFMHAYTDFAWQEQQELIQLVVKETLRKRETCACAHKIEEDAADTDAIVRILPSLMGAYWGVGSGRYHMGHGIFSREQAKRQSNADIRESEYVIVRLFYRFKRWIIHLFK